MKRLLLAAILLSSAGLQQGFGQDFKKVIEIVGEMETSLKKMISEEQVQRKSEFAGLKTEVEALRTTLLKGPNAETSGTSAIPPELVARIEALEKRFGEVKPAPEISALTEKLSSLLSELRKSIDESKSSQASGQKATPQDKAPAGKFSGYMMGDYYHNVSRDAGFTALANNASSSAAPGATAMQSFILRRVYLTYDNDIAEQFTTRFRLEADQGTDVLTSGKIGVFVKDAYLRWKNIFNGSDLIFGIQPPPTYDVSEGSWGYRTLEKTIMDLRGVYGSRDIGLSLKGKLVESGMFNYWVMVGKNAGNTPATSSKFNRYSAQLHVKPFTGMQATLYFDYLDAADKADPFNKGSFVGNAMSTVALFVGYAQPNSFNVGLEAFRQSTANGYTAPSATSLSTLTKTGYSAWGSVNISSDIVAVLRYDNYDPNANGESIGDLRNYLIGGVAFKLNKNVSITPNMLYETYEAPSNGSAPDASLTARVTFYYNFL